MKAVNKKWFSGLFDFKDNAVKRKWKRTGQAFLFLLPALLIAILFVYYPSVYTLNLSFFDWDMISPDRTFVGMKNFQEILSPGSDFWQSMVITLKYGLIYTAASLFLGMVFALALNRIKILNNFFQSLFFIPSVTSISVVAVIWSLIFNPQIGPLNKFLENIGMASGSIPQWLNDPKLAIIVLAVIGTWQSLGYTTLLLLAGLRNIPTSYYEAAAVDGSNRWNNFWYITLPLLGPVLYFVIFMLTINSFQVFGAVAIMTQGRPLGSTNVVLYYVYQEGFRFFDAGIASAASTILFMIIFISFIIQSKLGERSVFYQ